MGMRGILKKYEHIFKVIVYAYRGKKPAAIKAATFDEHNKMGKMISFAEFNMIFDDYKVSNVLIKKNQLKGILRETAEGYGGNMCTMPNFMESLCYIAQYAKLKTNGIDDAVSPKKKLRNLIFYMKQQHKEQSFKPYKLWESQPPKATKPKYKRRKSKSKVSEIMSPKKKKLLKQNQSVSMKTKIESLKEQNAKLQSELGNDAPAMAMDVMDGDILNGSPVKQQPIKKKKKKVNQVPSKYFDALYEKEMAAKKNISEKYAEYQERKSKEIKQKEQRRELKRKARMDQIKKNLESKKEEKRVAQEEKAKKVAEKKRLNAIRMKERAKKEAEEKKIKKRELQKFKAEKIKKAEDELKKQKAKEMKRKAKVTKETKKELIK